MSIYRDKKSGRWRFDFDARVGGQRVRRRQLLPAGWTRAQAEAFDRAESGALYAIATGIAKPRHHIDDAVSRWKRERAPALKHGGNVLRELETMREWWTERPIDRLAEVCQQYAEDQRAALQPATIRNRLAYLRAVCRWAWKTHQMAEADPGARVVVPPVRNARQVVVTRAQMVKLARACPHRGVRAMIRIAYYTGMRWDEIRRAERDGGLFVLRDTKNGEPRLVPALPIIRAAARVPMPRRSEFDYWFPMARERAELPHVRFHDLRHAAASAMVSAGVDLGTVGAVLGHKSAQTTKRYAHHATDRLTQALQAIRTRG